MQFTYLGEATFYEERMDELLAVAKSLEIKGLCNANETNDETDGEPMTPIETDDETLPIDQVISAVNLKEQTISFDHIALQRKLHKKEMEKGLVQMKNQSTKVASIPVIHVK